MYYVLTKKLKVTINTHTHTRNHVLLDCLLADDAHMQHLNSITPVNTHTHTHTYTHMHILNTKKLLQVAR